MPATQHLCVACCPELVEFSHTYTLIRLALLLSRLSRGVHQCDNYDQQSTVFPSLDMQFDLDAQLHS